MTFTIGGLFEGIGGFGYAFEAAGFHSAWMVEIDPFCQQVLSLRFPDTTLYGDIQDCRHLPYVDVITAGFPCQPFSVAGKGLGSDDARYLVPEMLRVIEEVMPIVVLFENVPRFRTLDDGIYFRELLRQLARIGFDAEWQHLRACDVGAPHVRNRWFCVAYRPLSDADCQRRRAATALAVAAPNTQRDIATRQQREQAVILETESSREVLANSTSARHSQGKLLEQQTDAAQTSEGVFAQPQRQRSLEYAVGNGEKTVFAVQRSSVETGDHADAVGDTHSVGVEGQRRAGKQVTSTRHSQEESEGAGDDGEGGIPESRLGRTAHGFSERLVRHRFPAGQGQFQYEFEPPRTVPANTPNRENRVHAIGNAVVPQVVYPLALSIREYLESLFSPEEKP